MVFAMSAGATQSVRAVFGMLSRLAGVSITPGRTALTRMPSCLYSASRASTSVSTAAFDVM